MKAIASAVLVSSMLGFAQTPPAIEAARVKPNKSGDVAVDQQIDPTRMRWYNTTLSILIRGAYAIQNHQLIGMPDWVDSDRWDVEATTTAPASERQMFNLLQGLLAERLKLQVHWETRELPKYRLSIAKGGLKMKPFDEKNFGAIRSPMRNALGLMDVHGATFIQFRNVLSGVLGTPIEDETGLTGKYEFKLEWAPSDNPEDPRPSIFTAMQSLGLKLDAIKGPVEVLVIDHVEKPTEN
jgi:uncharacterized protein (TIGR03435 family)